MANRKQSAAARKLWRAYAERATQYCRDVVGGKIRACKWVKLACQRHLDDMVRSRTKEFLYKFDPVRAGKVCAFIERFPHVKGKWAVGSQRLHLEPWQLFIVCSIFGWLNKDSGNRRFWEAIIMVPRKNGKTVLAAGIGLYMFVGDGEPGAEVYTGASDKKQSKEVFGPASKMAKRAEGFKEWFGITVAKESMYILEEGSKFEMVIGNPGDGPSPHCFIHDEFHEQPTFAQYDTAHTGVMAREQSLQLIISTAGVDVESPCHELQEDLKKVLEGDLVNDHLFGLVYTIDDPDRVVELPDGTSRPYWATIEAVEECNPNFGVSVLAEKIKADLEAAIHRTNRQNAFKIKNENIWVNAREAWMNMEKWRACGDPSLSLEEFIHDPCYEGCDLGARIDLTSRCKIFVRLGADGQKHYYLFAVHYVPEDRANDGDHPHYERWLKEGKIIGHPGPDIKLAFVERDINEDLRKLNYARIAFDPHQALQMQQTLKLQLGQDELQQDRVIDVPQRWQYLDPAMKEIEAAVLAKRLHHTGDPVLSWAIGNVVVKPDANENIFPRKETSRNKIDPATALFTGFYLALAATPLPEGEIEVW
ncbi:MAG: terminase large subunit [Patescibacteria group bacterium]|nr:terminase large subunit [Patescibacteria group bacterium]